MIKGQALVDFKVEFTIDEKCDQPMEKIEEPTLSRPMWSFFVDGLSNEGEARAGLILISP